MSTTTAAATKIDLDKYRLRRFVDRLTDMGEVEVHDEPVSLTGLSTIIERTEKAVLFKKAGPEQAEIVAKTAGNRKRIAAAFDTSRGQALRRIFQAACQPAAGRRGPVGRRAGAPGEDHRQGRRPDQAAVPSAARLRRQLLHELGDRLYRSIRRPDGATSACRRLSLRNRYETGTNVTAPSDLKRIYTACVARGEKLPITFTVGVHPLDFVAATMRRAGRRTGAGRHACAASPPRVVKSLTNDILVPADAEMMLEGYLDERGYVEPEGPYGEYMGYYGSIHMDPVFHCTAITMRRDVLHHTLLHGSAFVLDQTDSANISAVRTEAEAMRILKTAVREPVAVYLRSAVGRLQHAAGFDQAAQLRRGARRDRGAVRRHHAAQAYLCVRRGHRHPQRRQVEWAIGTRFQADQDLMVLHGMVGMTMDPSLQGRRTGAKAGFDCTKPFGRDGEIPLTRSAAKTFKGPARFQTVEQALVDGADVLCRHRRRRSAATTAARSPAVSTNCARTDGSAATATAAITWCLPSPASPRIVGDALPRSQRPAREPHDPNAVAHDRSACRARLRADDAGSAGARGRQGGCRLSRRPGAAVGYLHCRAQRVFRSREHRPRAQFRAKRARGHPAAHGGLARRGAERRDYHADARDRQRRAACADPHHRQRRSLRTDRQARPENAGRPQRQDHRHRRRSATSPPSISSG